MPLESNKHLHKGIIFIIFVLLLLLTGCDKNKAMSKTPPKAVNGFIDISNWNFMQDGIINLDGEWEFYWKNFIEPGNFETEKENMTAYINVPSYWNKLTKDGKSLNLENDGYATYRLIAKISENEINKRLAIKIKSITTSYKLWINGQLIYERGKVGTSIYDSIPSYKPTFYVIQPKSNILEIVIHVSNYFYYSSGIGTSISLGTEEQLVEEKDSFMYRDIFTFGGLTILMFYYLGFYFFRRKETASLFFVLCCASILMRTITANYSIILTAFGDGIWELECKLEYLGMTLTCIFFTTLLNYIFPESKINFLYKIIVISATLFSVLILLTPGRIYSLILLPIQIDMLLTFLYSIVSVFKSLKNKQESSVLYFAGVVIFGSCVTQDILYWMGIINTFDIGVMGFLIFLLFNALVLARKFSKSFNTVEKLSEELQKSNKKIIDTFKAVSETSLTVNRLVEKIYNYTNDVSTASKLISQAMLDNSENLQNQTDSIENGINSLRKLVTEINTVSKNTEIMSQKSVSAIGIVESESEKMNKMIQHINKIDNFINQLSTTMEIIYVESNNINKIVDIVSKIAKQTKLLSINASIEAAKAQKHGKGFSIIASEIKKLSDSTQSSIYTIKQFVSKINSNIQQAKIQAFECVNITKEGEVIVKDTFSAFEHIESGMKLIKENSESIEIESKQVLELSDNIFKLFSSIFDVAETIAASAQEVTASTEAQNDGLDKIVDELQDILTHVRFLNEKLKI